MKVNWNFGSPTPATWRGILQWPRVKTPLISQLPAPNSLLKAPYSRASVFHEQWTRLSSDLQYLLVSTVLVPKFSHIFNYTHQLHWNWTSLYDLHSNSRNIREDKTRVRKFSLKTWNSDLFCNSAMELSLLILKMASGYPLATFLHEKWTANRSRTMFTWWCACPNVVAVIWPVTAFIPPYTCMHLHLPTAFRCPSSKNAWALNHRSWPGWNRHLANSTAPRGQHVVKCVLRVVVRENRAKC